MRGDEIGTKNLANKIGRKFRQPLITGLWAFELPFKIPGPG